jgi:hypothetical protein
MRLVCRHDIGARLQTTLRALIVNVQCATDIAWQSEEKPFSAARSLIQRLLMAISIVISCRQSDRKMRVGYLTSLGKPYAVCVLFGKLFAGLVAHSVSEVVDELQLASQQLSAEVLIDYSSPDEINEFEGHRLGIARHLVRYGRLSHFYPESHHWR